MLSFQCNKKFLKITAEKTLYLYKPAAPHFYLKKYNMQI